MKNQWYSLYPGVNGLTVRSLGEHETFCEASDADDLMTEHNDTEPSVWIFPYDEMKNLAVSIEDIL